MKRFHVHVSVENLDKSVQFYSTLFGQAPSVVKADYAKWMLDDPRINFAISRRGETVGVDHLGLQVDSEEELLDLRSRLEVADIGFRVESQIGCCYARSNKHWTTDPAGVAWETYHTLGSIPTFHAREEKTSTAACCASDSGQAGTFNTRRETTRAKHCC
ncbi:ArsI/CadI family heavy metal resistance metalloenzyme [Bordetella tumulicola]|uniref:ArsI/CadI family heavy metal resistance metalloenzyme n=1 Tax=Bordetella tumulicola TaxID=1649133 RepID=UPI0039F10ECA